MFVIITRTEPIWDSGRIRRLAGQLLVPQLETKSDRSRDSVVCTIVTRKRHNQPMHEGQEAILITIAATRAPEASEGRSQSHKSGTKSAKEYHERILPIRTEQDWERDYVRF